MKKAKWARLELAKFTLMLLRGDGWKTYRQEKLGLAGLL
jgi:hypothetical protein